MSEDALRILYGSLLLVLVPVVWALMARSWRRRRAAGEAVEGGLPEPLSPGDPAPGEELAEAVYVSTVPAGRSFERVAAHGLGARSGAGVGVVGGAVVIRRDGARSLLLPGTDVIGAQRRRGQVGKVVAGRGGLVVITWRLGGEDVDTALHLRDPRDADDLVAAVDGLTGTTGSVAS